MIGNNVTVTILQIKGDRVRIGVNAPPEVMVRRKEAVIQTKSAPRMHESRR
jgi:carbon storage regulator CsrA